MSAPKKIYKIRQQLTVDNSPRVEAGEEILPQHIDVLISDHSKVHSREEITDLYIRFCKYYKLKGSLIHWAQEVIDQGHSVVKHWFWTDLNDMNEFIKIKNAYWRTVFTSNPHVIYSSPLEPVEISADEYKKMANDLHTQSWEDLEVNDQEKALYRQAVDQVKDVSLWPDIMLPNHYDKNKYDIRVYQEWKAIRERGEE